MGRQKREPSGSVARNTSPDPVSAAETAAPEDIDHAPVPSRPAQPFGDIHVPGMSTLPEESLRFAVPMREFAGTCQALLELAQFVAPKAAELDQPAWLAPLEQIVAEPTWSNEDRVRFRRDASAAVDAAFSEALDKARDGRLAVPSEDDESGDSRTGGQRVPKKAAESFVHGLAREVRSKLLAVRPAKQSLLMRSLLTSLVGALEVLVGNTFAAFYYANPTALGDETAFSLADLRRYKKLDDAVDEAIARRVDSLLRENIDHWRRWFERHVKVDLAELAVDWDALAEVIQRRHAIAHNAGRASRQYLSRVSENSPEVQLGDELPVSEEYFSEAVDQVLVIGILIAACTWKHSVRQAGKLPGAEVWHELSGLMDSDRWRTVEHLAAAGEQRLAVEGMQRVAFRYNYWLARKRQRGTAAIQQEVEAYDDTALSAQLRFVKLALLDRTDEAEAMLDDLLRTNELSPLALREWPVLKELRDDARVAMRIKKMDARLRRKRRAQQVKSSEEGQES